MDPRHLVQLASILEKGSISRASEHLHLSQPTLTHNMQILEVQAGGRLFERSRFGVRSTALGEMLAREGRAIARRLKDAVEITEGLRGGLRRSLRIGCGPLIGAALIPALLEDLHRGDAHLQITVQSDRPHLVVDQLVDGRHDAVIAPSWQQRPPQGVERFLLIEDRLSVFCGPTHPFAAQGVLPPGAGEAQQWISLGTASPFDQDVREMLTRAGAGVPRVPVRVLGDSSMLLGVLMRGHHLAVLPRAPARMLHARFPLVELAVASDASAPDTYLWCRENFVEDGAFVKLREALERCVNAMELESNV